MAREYQQVGRVVGLSHILVKSMASEDISKAKIGWHGLEADRRYAFVQSENKTGFPWFTAREYPGLVRYRPYLAEPANPRDSAVRVVTPDGADYAVDAPEVLDRLQTESGKPLRLLHNWSGIFDAMDISLISVESRRSVEKIIGHEVDHRRFRSNITIETSPFVTRDFPEDKFVGGVLKIGDHDDAVRIRVNRKDLRCMVVNVDPETAKQDPAVLKAIVTQRRNLLGVYGTTERPGAIRLGDGIFLAKE